eukprot:g8257.t1
MQCNSGTGAGAWGTAQGGAWNSATGGSGNGIKKPTTTEMELSQREAEIREREKMLEQRQNELRNLQRTTGTGATVAIKNWPPCSPILYHDIDAEIPVGLQSTVRNAYRSYLLFCATLLYNFLCLTLAFAESMEVLAWIFGGIYAVTGIPGAFILWYGRLYNAASYDRAVTFMCFFLGNAIHIGFCIWAAIAVPVGIADSDMSFAGIIQVFRMFDKTAWLGVMYLICFVLWTGNAVLSVYVWQAAMRDFRGRGGPQQLQSQAQAAAGRAVIASATQGRV